MLLSAVSVLVGAQSSSEIPEGLMNNPVYNSVIFYHSNMFRQYCVFFRQFLHLVLKPDKNKIDFIRKER